MGKQVKINKADAVEMFTAIGFTTAKKWTTKRLQSKANRMDTAPEDSLGNKKLDELVDVCLSSENILIVDEVEETKKKDTKPKTKVKTVKATVINNKKVKTEKKEKVKTEKKEKKEKAPKEKKEKKAKTEKDPKEKKEKTSTEKDKFGSRVGSSPAKFNACLQKKAKTMAELVKESGLSITMYDHVKKLIERKLVIKTDKGFKLP